MANQISWLELRHFETAKDSMEQMFEFAFCSNIIARGLLHYV
jgi:hypothetical protein